MEVLRFLLGGVADLLKEYLGLWGRGMSALSGEFDLNLSSTLADFLGFVLGSLSIFGFLNAFVKWNRKGNQPQAFPLKTTETPDQVVSKDIQNFLGMMLKIALLLVFLAVLVSARR